MSKMYISPIPEFCAVLFGCELVWLNSKSRLTKAFCKKTDVV